MEAIINYYQHLYDKNGPDPSDYETLQKLYSEVARRKKEGSILQEDIEKFWNRFPDIFSVDTMQGFASRKPHGYSGDYEIIDRTYTFWKSPKNHLVKWDEYYHSQDAPIAVRNRKNFIIDLFIQLEGKNETAHFLNVGCGPAREVYEYTKQVPYTGINFHCLDLDFNAINYAQKVVNGNGVNGNIDFHCKNAFRFKGDIKYDLVWSAGLFDYLDDRKFIFLAKHLYNQVSRGGSLIIGNFSKDNPTKDYMECCGRWYLIYRSKEELLALAEKSGFPHHKIRIESEPKGINLFLVIEK